MRSNFAVLVVFVFLIVGRIASGQDLQRFEYVHPAMGVKFKIVLYAKDRTQAESGIKKSIAQIDRLDLLLSDYKSSSEIRKLCATAPHSQWQPVSVDLYNILKISHDAHKNSAGAFDVTIGNVSRLWRQARKKRKMPQAKKLASALATVGMKHVQIGKNHRVKLLHEGIRIDFGAIAKGYAADRVIDILKKMNIQSALVDASGDIVVSDPPPGRNAWKIEVFGIHRSKRSFVELKNQAIATSGDLYQFFEVDGKRYSHIVDPKTGIGVSGPMSVTVIAPSGSAADAMASAVSVRFAKDQFQVLQKQNGVHACVVRFKKEQPTIQKTKGFPKLQFIEK